MNTGSCSSGLGVAVRLATLLCKKKNAAESKEIKTGCSFFNEINLVESSTGEYGRERAALVVMMMMMMTIMT
jgi:hypothetical protein